MKRHAREIYGHAPDILRRERAARLINFARMLGAVFVLATVAALGAPW